MEVEIIQVKTKKQLKTFINFVYTHYKDDACYVPELYLSHKWMLTKSNPFFKHSEAAYFLAFLEGKIVGRIAVIYNKTHLEVYKDQTGFFGFFESTDDANAANALLYASITWLKHKGLTKIVGPTNLTTNDSCGILVDGFEKPPVVLMPYNKTYYDKLLVQFGFEKAMDLFSYNIDGNGITRSYQTVLDRCQSKLNDQNIKIRHINLKKFDEELKKLRFVYNKTNEENWGFIPLNVEEFKAMADQLKMVTPPEFVLIAEKSGETIGYLIAIPDLNQVFSKIRMGHLLPFGIIKILWYKRKINHARILILGVLKEYSNTGLDLLLYKRIKDTLNEHGIFSSEACYVMESNNKMNSILHKIDGKIVNKYRMYSYIIK